MNSAYKTLLDANVTEALSQVKTSKSFAQNMRDIFQKVKTEVQESFQRFKDDPSMASKVVDMQYTDMQGNIVPKPKNVKQYKEFAKGMLA